MLPGVEPDQLDRGVPQRPSHLRLLVSLRIVGQPVPLVEHVERGLDRGRPDPERQRALRIQARLAGQRDHLALDAVEAGRESSFGRRAPHQAATCAHTRKQARSLQLAAVTTVSRSIRAMEGTLPKIETSPRRPSSGPSP